jgi:hypothetical protein
LCLRLRTRRLRLCHRTTLRLARFRHILSSAWRVNRPGLCNHLSTLRFASLGNILPASRCGRSRWITDAFTLWLLRSSSSSAFLFSLSFPLFLFKLTSLAFGIAVSLCCLPREPVDLLFPRHVVGSARNYRRHIPIISNLEFLFPRLVWQGLDPKSPGNIVSEFMARHVPYKHRSLIKFFRDARRNINLASTPRRINYRIAQRS